MTEILLKRTYKSHVIYDQKFRHKCFDNYIGLGYLRTFGEPAHLQNIILTDVKVYGQIIDAWYSASEALTLFNSAQVENSIHHTTGWEQTQYSV